MFRRQLVTKYFDDNARPYIESGSFQFGTLKRYRDEERTATEFLEQDKGEGKNTVGIFPANGKIDHIRFSSGEEIIGGTFTGGGPDSVPIKYENVVNDYVFCTSIGGYSRHQHEVMTRGVKLENGDAYLGSDKLKNYAVIDVAKFIMGLEAVLKNHAVWKTSLEVCQALIFRPVQYGQRNRNRHVSSNYKITNGDVNQDYFDAVFTKPTIYSPEKEFRFVLRPRSPFGIGSELYPLSLQHKLFRRAIMDIGP